MHIESIHPIDQETAAHLIAARSGDQAAFKSLTDPYQRELISHCYRMLGSLQDAEDGTQETLFQAWNKLGSYEGRGPFRAWLYKIATNVCLDTLKRQSRRALPTALGDPSEPWEPPRNPIFDPIWLEPFPDELLAPLTGSPEARFEAYESITLAFLTALQTLPPRQRAALILGDVLDFSIGDVANLLDTTESAINSMLYRARSKLSMHYASGQSPRPHPHPLDEQTQQLLDQYVRAWQKADIDALVALLKEDATFPMPPLPMWYRGREAIKAFVSATILNENERGRWHLLPVRANAQPGFAWYRKGETGDKYQAYAIQVLTIQDDLLADITTFGFPGLFHFFGLNPEIEP